MRQNFRRLLVGSIAAGLGVVLFVLSSMLSSGSPFTGTMGFPLSHTGYISNCPPGTVNPRRDAGSPTIPP